MHFIRHEDRAQEAGPWGGAHFEAEGRIKALELLSFLKDVLWRGCWTRGGPDVPL